MKKKLWRYSEPAGAVVHMFHGALWGGWQYMVASQANDSSLTFGYGGYQAIHFQTTFRPMPTASAEGESETEGSAGNVSARRVF